MKNRIIPTVLTDGISQVKGTEFNNWRTVGHVLTAIRVHSARDVDELVLLDVNATGQGRKIDPGLVADASKELRIPLTVGGGVSSVHDFADLLAAGADKIVIGTAAAEKPELISELSSEFGSQAIVCSIDTVNDSRHSVRVRSGKDAQEVDPVDLAKRLETLGAGEFLVQSVSRDGNMQGMALELFSAISKSVKVPVIGSSGAANSQDFIDALTVGCSAVACGALFQFTETTPSQIKAELQNAGILVRR